ncbi:hypothetical protein HK405_003401, partial [Cladochytrium tenue]
PGCLGIFVEVVLGWEMLEEPQEQLVKLKACLWAVGHVYASESEAVLLDGFGVVQTIVKMVESTSVLSLKGTCFYILGLVSQSRLGRYILRSLGWESTFSSDGAMGICLPS